MVKRRTHEHRRWGLTMVELLIVIAIIGIVAGLSGILGRPIAQRASERAALNTVQQAVWQGATLAAARGFRTVLCRNGPVMTIRRVLDPLDPNCDGPELRRFEIDEAVTLTGIADDGMSIVFTPPGTIVQDTLPGTLSLEAAGKTYALEVSLIGEVRVQ